MDDAQFEAERQHWEISELLDLYVQLLLDGQDAAAMYPQVAEHVETCDLCQLTLETLTTQQENADDPLLSGELLQRLSDLHVRHTDEQVCISGWRAGDAFRIRIGFTPAMGDSHLAGMRGADSAMRGIVSIPSGGRLLLEQSLTLGGEPVVLLLTLHNSQTEGCYDVVGELFGDHLPAAINARLHVASETYFARIQGQSFRFTGVNYPTEPENLQITLETA